jgi:hypothetical protein
MVHAEKELRKAPKTLNALVGLVPPSIDAMEGGSELFVGSCVHMEVLGVGGKGQVRA